ncbi:hypothetical protein Hanom_Chr04g00330461 [Helianthus anomalus]
MVVGLCRVTATVVNTDDGYGMTVLSNDGDHSKRDKEIIRKERLRRRGFWRYKGLVTLPAASLSAS